jgi:hypothetical protein
MELTVVCVRGGALLAHKTVCLKCVSRFQIDISLFPCTADMIHDCSVGWHIRRRIRVPAAHKQTKFSPVHNFTHCTVVKFSIIFYGK